MRLLTVVLYLLTIGLLLQADEAQNTGFRDLFNGKDLDGWVVEGTDKDKAGNPVWSVKNGHILCQGFGGGFLRYDRQEFGDFVLRVEYRFAEPDKSAAKPKVGNSGIGIRTMKYDPKNPTLTRPSFYSFEVQLLDDAGKAPNEHGNGALYRYVSPTVNATRPAPEWNEIEITCQGPRIRVRVNGQEVVDADQTRIPDLEKGKPKGVAAPKDKPLKGYVCLQNHGSTIEFRKVQIRELSQRPSGANVGGN